MAAGSDSFQLFLNAIVPSLSRIQDVITILGLAYIGKVSFTTIVDIVVGLRAHLWSRLWKKNFVKKYGKWGVVTGCTDGIGKAYAEELAKEQMNLVLVSRNRTKLEYVSNELIAKYNIETELVQVDFSDGKPIYDSIAKSLTGKEIGMLINNVGVMLPYPKCFGDVTDQEIWSHVNVNMASVCCMTKLVIRQMLKRDRGAIVNIASVASFASFPLLGIYGASKAFVDSFSVALEWEYRSTGLTIQTVNPSYVATKMLSFSSWLSTSFLFPSAPVFASNAVRTIGYTKRTTGFWFHGIQMWFIENFMSKWSYIFSMDLLQRALARNVKKAP